jgi:hypothetical protein
VQFAEAQHYLLQAEVEAALAAFFSSNFVEMGAANSCASARTVDPRAYEADPRHKGRIARVNAAILPVGAGGTVPQPSPSKHNGDESIF